jgi:uncharacterized secreted protein with C-terminal beta-propeller domain
MEKGVMVQREIKRKTRLYGMSAVLSAVVLISLVYFLGVAPILLPPSQAPVAGEMKTFASTQEIANYLNANSEGQISYEYAYIMGGGDSPIQTTSTFSARPEIHWARPEMFWDRPNDDYSTTNIQVYGVDEVDTVKTDGQYIYMISTASQTKGLGISDFSVSAVNAVYIIEANAQKSRAVSKITLDDTTHPDGLFLSRDSNQLVVLANKYIPYTYREDYAEGISHYSSEIYTCIDVYDISNKAQPILTRNFTLSGSYFNSRMIGDIVYAVVSQPATVYGNIVTLPVVYEDRHQCDVSPNSIYYTDMNDSSFIFTSVYGLNLADETSTLANMTVMMGGTSAMYVSPQNVYITYPGWDQTLGQYTSIYRVAINGVQLSLEAQGSIPGSILNQYSMDEYEGNFRVATNYYGPESQTSNIYVLNSELTVVGKLEGLAPNENLHATRFMGDKCYLVTFKVTDPLFVIDLSAPNKPKVLGELKIPGYSDYLHPYDETHLIGLGKETTESATGDFAWYHGLKLALFDVSNVNKPTQLTSYGIGDRGTDTSALSDPHAFLFDKERNLLVIPVSLALIDNQTTQNFPNTMPYGEIVWQGAYVFNLNLDNGFTLKGTIAHLNPTLLDTKGHLQNPSNYYATQNDWITRTLYIGNILYTISNTEIKLTDLTDMTPISSINLQGYNY